MNVAELRHVCEANGIDHDGLTKRRMIEALREYDRGQSESGNEMAEAENDEIELGGGDNEQPEDSGSVEGSSSPSAGEVAEPGSVVELRLQLALVQAKREARREEWEIEKEKLAIHSSQQGPSQVAMNVDPSAVANLKLMLPTMINNDDALSFFHAFERTLEINEIQRSRWIKYLPAQLSPKALKAFTRLTLEESRDYDVVKRTILSYYKLDAHAYLKSFKTQRRTGNETYKMFLNKLSETFAYWQEAKGIESLEMLSDAILADQFLLSLPDNVRTFVSARQPKNAAECAEFADLCYEVSLMTGNGNKPKDACKGQWTANQNRPGNGNNNGANNPFHKQSGDQKGPRNGPPFSGAGYFASEKAGNKPKPYTESYNTRPQNFHHSYPPKFAAPFCVMCGKHHNPNSACRGDKQYGVYAAEMFGCNNVVINSDPFIVPLFLEGKQVRALRDTGNNGPVLVDESLVPSTAYIPNTFVYCSGAFDEKAKHKIPLAEVRIRSPRFNYDKDVRVRVGVCRMPDNIDCNIGNDLFRAHPELTDIVALREDEETTIARPDRQDSDELSMISSDCDTNHCEQTATAPPDGSAQMITRSTADEKQPLRDMTLAADGINQLGSDAEQTDTQRTRAASRRTADNDLNETLRDFGQIDINDVDDGSETGRGTMTRNEFQSAQEGDKSLACLWDRARAGSQEYRIIGDTLYKASPANSSGTQEFLLVVPERYRSQLLRIAHDLPFSGHLGARKTEQRLKALFYWPKMQTMIRQYVRSCKQCQMVAPKRGSDRAPLQPLEIMHTHAFDDVTVDVMGGQLPISSKGNKYVMLIVCNVSKWVHGIPLRNLRAETIADKLIEFFCIYGIPRVIRGDNFSSFRSQLLTKIRQRLGIDARYSAPFHYQSHGAIERVNLTVENMLRKYIHQNPRRWDDLLPFLLFALREVPHSSTGYSPAELVFGRRLRGLLNVARETWTSGDPAEKQLNMSTTRYMEQLEQKIKSALEVAKENVAVAQQTMKKNYDKLSSVRQLEPGEMALVLLPTSGNKLLSAWNGPFKVLRKCENNNYEIQIGRRKAILHINSLRKFHEPQTKDDNDIMMIVTDDAQLDDEDLMPSAPQLTEAEGGSQAQFSIGQQLTAEQRADMERLLSEYSDIFTEKPGKTDLVRHSIKLSDETPCYQASYRIPETMRDAVYDELMKMVDNGIIKYDPDTSWNSPLIIVKKSDGGIRLVNNFINLNKKTLDERYQMTNANELLSRVAGAKYLTKIDLRSAFFQIELTPNSQQYTGFQTPFGTFSYVSMAMGLKGASSTCQKLMDIVLRGAHKYAGTLLDDILCFDKDYASHLNHVRDVLERLRNAGLTANVKKCHFASNRIKVLGHIVEDGLIHPDDDKIKVIQAWKPPTNKKQLKSFLGTTGYFRDFVEHYATIVFPLTEMLARNKPDKLTWGESELQAFNKLKMALISKPILRPPDMSKDFKIFCDSSTVALSSILMQQDDKTQKNYVVAYASRKLLPRERNYAIVELELMAIVFALTKFKHWTHGKRIEVFSDHRPLQWLNSLSKHSGRLARWNLIIQDYDLITTYIPGEKQIADSLTRLE